MMFPLVTQLARGESRVPVAVSCRVLGFSRQAYYAWLTDPISRRDLENAYLTDAALDIHHDDPEFGYRFIADELNAAGHVVSERRVWRLCSAANVFSIHARRRGKGRRPGPPVHDDLVRRDFTSARLDRLWLTDISEHPTAEGKLYLCAIKDTCSGRIVGYSMNDRMTSDLAVTALAGAVARRGGPAAVTGCVVHSDRGSQFRSRAFVEALARHGLVGSMGRVGAAGDNAAMESFFALLQNNVLDRRRWSGRDELRLAIITWIERTYHRRRRQRRLGKLTPIEYETIHHTAADAA